MRPLGQTAAVPKSDRRRRQEQAEAAAHIVESWVLDEDADLYNWADEATRNDPIGAVYELARLAGQLAKTVATNTGRNVAEVVREAALGTDAHFLVPLPAYVVEVGDEAADVTPYAGFTARDEAERLVSRVQEQGDEPVWINLLPIYRTYEEYESDR